MEQKHLDQSAATPGLGPHYFAARDHMEKFMEGFEAEQFGPLLKKASEAFYERLLEDVQNYLRSNIEANLQGEIWRGTEDSVKALMTGERWALERYALEPRYGDGTKIREAVAKHIPAELQAARIKDLEAETERLRTDLRLYRGR